jgi:hypothetical protein
MYSFSKGQSRLFVKGSREVDDNDNITDPGEHSVMSHSRVSHHRDHGITSAELSSSSKFESKSQMASASQESRELLKTNNVRSGLKTVHTQKVVRKTTTISLGEKKESTHVKVRGASACERGEAPVLIIIISGERAANKSAYATRMRKTSSVSIIDAKTRKFPDSLQ